MDFSRFFREKCIVRRVMEARESRTPCFFMSIPTIKYLMILKALPQVCMEYTAQSECRVANIAQGEAECYICHTECCIFHTKEVAVL